MAATAPRLRTSDLLARLLNLAAFSGHALSFRQLHLPFYSPEILGNSTRAWIHGTPSWWPPWINYSRAFLRNFSGRPADFGSPVIIIAALTYKAFWADPPACAVGEPRHDGAGPHCGALNIGGSPILSIWAGWMLDPNQPDFAGFWKR